MTSTQYKCTTRINEAGQTVTTTVPEFITARRQISYFGKIRAAEDATSQTNMFAQPPPVTKSISERDETSSTSSDDETDDIEAQLEREEDLYDIEPLTKLNTFDIIAKIDANKYNIPKKDDFQLYEITMASRFRRHRWSATTEVLSHTQCPVSTSKNRSNAPRMERREDQRDAREIRSYMCSMESKLPNMKTITLARRTK